MSRAILIVEDDQNLSGVLSRVLTREGYEVAVSNTVREGVEHLQKETPGIVLTDIYLPDGKGIEVLECARTISKEIDVIVMTANATVESAIEAMKKGAHDYLLKPFQVDELTHHVRKIFERKALIAENLYLKERIKSRCTYSDIVGKSSKMRELFSVMENVANTRSSVLIQGESGTGKELIARAIHFTGNRSEKMFVPINCSAIPENLLESELFGHVKGAYTGATENKRGLFEYADQGTLFLDEIGDLSAALQSKLLRALEDGRIRRVGDYKEIEVDVRIVAATNKDLATLLKEGIFREDLFFRLAVIPIMVPPLRERKEDIKLLAEHFVSFYSDGKVPAIRFGKEAMEILVQYPWPGNVRELKNLTERLSILKAGKTIAPGDLPKDLVGEDHMVPSVEAGLSYQEARNRVLEQFHRKIIGDALKENGGNVSRASESLGVDRGNFQRLMRRYGIQSAEFRDE
ncbi:MAG: sigma-54-dependent Fis family transcriptional regulator [Deltaproteobacteria bacterium]|nr:sigma-54-dependent Fis family transcriptional regulator [Deltaproteobacteria bacterium]